MSTYVIYIEDINKYLGKNKDFTDNLSEAKNFYFLDLSVFYWKYKINKAGSYAHILKSTEV